jgi:protease-4
LAAFLRTFLAVVFAILFLVVTPLFLLVMIALFQDTGPRSGSWLTIRLDGELLEHYGPPTLIELFEDPPPCLMEITENLEKAAVDDRITGVLFRLDFPVATQGKLDEIRDGIRRVRDAGKPVYAYATYLEDSGLYLASECDSTFLFPRGRVFLLGRGASVQHVKGTLEKLGVHAEFHATGDYKSAIELFTEEHSSPESLENVRWLLQDLSAAYDETLAANLDLDPADLDRLRARVVVPAAEAVAEGLVDETLWFDELRDRLRGTRRTWRSVSSADYAHVDRGSVGLNGKATIAVVHAQGFVASGGEDHWDGVNGLVMGPDRVVADLRDAWEDDDVRAIVLRWDTGGGAVDGSQRIGRAVARARQEKPVVVSIADRAASGGYMMSYPANRIVCAENGITGSIGAFIGKFNARGLWEKLGMTFDEVQLSENAFLFSTLHDWTPQQNERIAEDTWRTYREWVEDIAQRRGLTFDEIDAVSQGRVWTGRQALERSLVDETGGFRTALAAVRRLADLDEDEPVRLLHYPERRSAVEMLFAGDLPLAARSALWLRVREALFSSSSRLPGTLAVERLGVR